MKSEEICCIFKDVRRIGTPKYEAFETLKDYGNEFEGHILHRSESGKRALLRCRKCGKLMLYMESEISDWDTVLEYTERVFVPVESEEEAEQFNRDYSGALLITNLDRVELIF